MTSAREVSLLTATTKVIEETFSSTRRGRKMISPTFRGQGVRITSKSFQTMTRHLIAQVHAGEMSMGIKKD